MDRGLFGTSRAADRGAQPVGTRPTSAAVTTAAPRPASNDSTTTHRESTGRRGTASNGAPKRRWTIILVALLAAVVLAAVGWLVWQNVQSAKTGLGSVDSSKYQAVFLTNGQVYFGKLQASDSEYFRITEVFYLQKQVTEQTDTNTSKSATTTDQNQLLLIRLGDAVHGPEDEMIISKNQVLFYENLKSDGKVAQLISQYKNTK